MRDSYVFCSFGCFVLKSVAEVHCHQGTSSAATEVQCWCSVLQGQASLTQALMHENAAEPSGMRCEIAGNKCGDDRSTQDQQAPTASRDVPQAVGTKPPGSQRKSDEFFCGPR
jgi:hypothetical protein